ncbi:MAG: hypothetical protein JXQ65_07690 [Candidatus Marinimicrobia bacterium]|nr:hypothetical protein [Candidatus Neomarinimicrobiota bacterium]
MAVENPVYFPSGWGLCGRFGRVELCGPIFPDKYVIIVFEGGDFAGAVVIRWGLCGRRVGTLRAPLSEN